MSTRWVTCALVLIAASLSAQEPPTQPAETARKRLEYFLGRWKTAGTSRSDGKAEAFTGAQRCEWLETGRLVICRGGATDVGGPIEEVASLGYDAFAGHYTRYNVDLGAGGSGFATGKAQGKVWRWTGVSPSQPKTRFSWTEDSAELSSFEIQASLNGKFATIAEGRMTRVK